jgi:hypothetical protein
VPPTTQQVKEYCQERANGIDAEYFVDYYATRGWRLSNGKQVADWRACVRTWEKREIKGTPRKVVVAQEYQQRDYTDIQRDFMDEQSKEIEAMIAAR